MAIWTYLSFLRVTCQAPMTRSTAAYFPTNCPKIWLPTSFVWSPPMSISVRQSSQPTGWSCSSPFPRKTPPIPRNTNCCSWKASFGGALHTFYRFRSSDGVVDYYDGEGRSARQFLLRNPVPNGVFRSPFGKRKHPILGYVRMHWGVDWAAPRGTPIIAPGNGVVTKAGWASGYGKQTVIRHANGYETSYSHQSKFAKGIREGTRVRQGQVIGYIGTTGLSTGPHLHYEMKVNGNRVDPMRVRLPKGRVLAGEELQAFASERDRINALLGKDGKDQTVFAQVAG